MEFSPVALACGHLLEGPSEYEVFEDGTPATVMCPAGCGPVGFVVEPPDLREAEIAAEVEAELGDGG